MSRKLGHPPPAALASLRAGLPGVRHGRRLCLHVARCPDCASVCAQLDAVSEALSAPQSSLPPAVERRIVMTIAIEAARRAARSDESPRAFPRLALPRPRPLIIAPAIAGALAMCAGFGYLLCSIRTGPARPVPTAGQAASVSGRSAPPAVELGNAPSGIEGSRARGGRAAIGLAPAPSHNAAFMVTDSNITYHKATLPAQLVRALALQDPDAVGHGAEPGTTPPTASMASPGGAGGGPGPSPGGAPPGGSAITAAEVAPSPALVGCVLHLTGDVTPAFVDQATYQSERVYVIAVTDKAWVVGIDCTASRPTLITSVQLGTAR